MASLDGHEGILYFVTRGYACEPHPPTSRQLFAGHDLVVLRKPGGSA